MVVPAPVTAPIRTGIIGFGTSGRVFHAPFIAANPDYSLDVIVTADDERRAAAHRLHPGARIVSTPDELFALADVLDLVVIGSPSATHVELAHAALGAGIAVVVDKPLSVTGDEGRALIRKSEQLGVPFTVFQNRRWDGDFLTVADLLRDGALGTIACFESRFEWWKPDVPTSWKSEATIAQGGGILYDLGAHLIDQALLLFGPVDDIYAEVATRRDGGVADDDVFVSFRHESGTRSHLWMNGLAAQVGPRYHVLGSKAGYTKWGLDGQEPALKAGALPSDTSFGDEPESTWGEVGVDGALQKVPTRAGQYHSFYVGLADALLRGAPVPVDPRDSVAVIDIIEHIHRSHQ